MPTSIPTVAVTHAENAYTITCSCTWTTRRRMRIDADIAATTHIRTHGHPHHDDHQEEDHRG